MSQYVGKTISLVSKASVRYIGTLATVSAESSSLVLKDVQDYGTEDRVSGAGSIPGNPSVISEMTFLGTDVADLQVLDDDEDGDGHDKQTEEEDEPSDDFYAQTQHFAEDDSRDEVDEAGAKPVYNKSESFFDNFVEPSDQKSFVKHNAMNSETFGSDATYAQYQQQRNNRGGRNRRGRGNSNSRNNYYYDKRNNVFRDSETHEEFNPESARGGRGGGFAGGRGGSRGGRGGRGRGRGGRGGRGRGRGQASEFSEFIPGGDGPSFN